jgi:hypothetical protein
MAACCMADQGADCVKVEAGTDRSSLDEARFYGQR